MVLLFTIAALVSILQLTAVIYAKIGSFVFNLPIIFLVFFSLRKGFVTGLMLGIFLGVFNGIFQTGPFWLIVFLYSFIGGAVGYIGKWFYRENILIFIIMVAIAESFIYFFYYALNPGYSQVQLDMMDFISTFILPSVSYSVLASVFLFYFFRRLVV